MSHIKEAAQSWVDELTRSVDLEAKIEAHAELGIEPDAELRAEAEDAGVDVNSIMEAF
jgi:hypothetical protein